MSDSGTPANEPFQLHRDAFGCLVLVDAAGVAHTGVVPVRPFPISAPGEGLSLVSADGHELAWVDDAASLPAAQQALIDEELAVREFVPEIRAILEISGVATPSTWRVATDRGETTLVLEGEQEIRRLPGGILLIADREGLQFLIRDPGALDRASRRLLDRFL
ncbi:MAG TPA: DUF1854 domain-containing protein [Burkholderiaceae bacterium]|nr:DUF1854 domain-containing protein [Burkholderiaceae bacterium]